MSDCTEYITPSSSNMLITSNDVKRFDGLFSIVTLPANPSLDDTLEAIDTYIGTIAAPVTSLPASSITFNPATITCHSYTATDVQVMFEQVAVEICANETSITSLSLASIGLDSLTGLTPATLNCVFGSTTPTFTPNNLLGFLDSTLDKICDINTAITPIDTTSGKAAGQTGESESGLAGSFYIRDVINGITIPSGGGFHNWISSGGTLSTVLLSANIAEAIYFVEGFMVHRSADSVTLIATSDNYIDIKTDGTYVNTSVAVAAPAPPLLSGRARLHKVTTDATTAISATELIFPYAMRGEMMADETIITRVIEDGAVTGAKLETIGAAASAGSPFFLRVTYDDKGRVTAATDALNIGVLADGDILQYDLGTTNWVNTPVAGSILPAASTNETMYYNGAAWDNSSFFINTGSALGIGVPSAQTPQAGLTIGYNQGNGLELTIPVGVSATATTGGSLGAGTYYYVVVAYDQRGGKTVRSSQVAAGVDGVTTTKIDINWTSSRHTATYSVFRGTVDGTYTEKVTGLTSSSLSDIGAATGWAAAVAGDWNQADTDAYVYYLSSNVWFMSGLKFNWSSDANTSMQFDVSGTPPSAEASAAFHISCQGAEKKGVLFPRMTTAQKNGISSPATGLVLYDTTLNKLCVYTGAAWETVTSS